MEQGTLFVKLESAREALPVQGRVVISQTVNGVRVLEIDPLLRQKHLGCAHRGAG